MLTFHKRFISSTALALALAFAHAAPIYCASKPRVIAFGKWTTVPYFADRNSAEPGAADGKPLSLKIRSLLVDARVKEFTLGPPHEVTDRLFVVRRVFRMNDSLPQESNSPPRWQWQRGGWLLIDRLTGRISPINLPEFDPQCSATTWYRDFAAYCGISEDGKKIFAMVAQINRRKPVLKKILEGKSTMGEEPKTTPLESTCTAPAWQRTPTRVTFQPADAAEQTFAIRGHVVDLVTEEEDDEEAEK